MKKSKGPTVLAVVPGSIAEEAGIETGDRVISVNGEVIKDIFDFRFLTAQEQFVIRIRKQDGGFWDIDIEKDEYEDIGIEFKEPLGDVEKSCSNKCIFCFIDQLPPHMRDTLYYKDDDARLSFLTGNYITMTNMDENELNRIIKYKLSPVNVSVHTTNPELRIKMLRNKRAGIVLERIRRLTDAGISVNCQIVLCRGINDGEELERTIRELGALYPGVHSISVVPVGLTRHRQGLFELEPFDSLSAAEVLQQIEAYAGEFSKTLGSAVIYAADEFYVLAGSRIPEYNRYEDFPQLENGVGMLALFNKEFDDFLEELPDDVKTAEGTDRKISIATGMIALEYIKAYTERLKCRFSGLQADVYGIRNELFGERVTVSGLVAGGDLISQLRGKDLGDELLIPENMLKSGETVFLDNITVAEAEEQLRTKVTAVKPDGEEFIRKVLNV